MSNQPGEGNREPEVKKVEGADMKKIEDVGGREELTKRNKLKTNGNLFSLMLFY